MIKKIIAKRFKGLFFQDEIGQKTIFYGENGTGKSARVQALQIAILGYVPGLAKTNQEIFSNFSSSDKFSVGFESEIEIINFEKKTISAGKTFKKTESGSVSLEYGASGKKIGKSEYDKILAQIGDPKVFDIAGWNKLSDAKKIELLFSTFPTNGDPLTLAQEIEIKKEAINLAVRDLRTKQGTIAELFQSKKEIQLPSGTFAQLEFQIESSKNELEKIKSELIAVEKAEVEEARKIELQKIELKRKAEALAAAEREKAQTEKIKALEDQRKIEIEANKKREAELIELRKQQLEKQSNILSQDKNPLFSIQKIIDTIENICGQGCMAGLIARQELVKYR